MRWITISRRAFEKLCWEIWKKGFGTEQRQASFARYVVELASNSFGCRTIGHQSAFKCGPESELRTGRTINIFDSVSVSQYSYETSRLATSSVNQRVAHESVFEKPCIFVRRLRFGRVSDRSIIRLWAASPCTHCVKFTWF